MGWGVKALPSAGPARPLAEEQPAMADPDADLVRAAQRDPERFLALYDRYFPRVHGYVRARVRDAASAEDVTSQVFTTALAKIGSFQATGSFGAWLFRIAQNAVADAYRARRPERAADDTFDALPDADPGPEERALAGERAGRVRALVGTLHPEQQHLLALRYGAGLSFPEIGQAVGKTAVAARVGVHRILEDLRRRYPYDE